jgi:enediyne biosynthesis protein E4
MNQCRILGLLALILFAHGGPGGAQSILLNDVTDNCGVNFVHSDGSYGQRFVIEVMSGGLALLDYDNDGDLDIYFLNGAPIRKPLDDPPARDALFRNDGNFKFSQVTLPAGLGDTSMGLGIGWGDYDNDGFRDLYVNNYGPNVLYHNCGDGTYEVVTDMAGVANGNLVGGGVAFFDKEGDGDLDLYVANYVKFDPAAHRIHIHKGVPAYPSPLSYEPEKHTLYENNGDGTFKDVSESSGIHAVAGRGMGLVAFDFDDDGDVDVFVANDTQENFLFQNDGHGKFEEVALSAGVAYDSRGRAQASMGVDILDADQDGRMDLFVTAFSEEFAPFYRNLGNGFFEDLTLRAGTSTATFPHVTWGIVAEDFDNDGMEDIFVGCGDLDDNKSQRGGTNTATAFNVENLMLQGTGKSKFKDLKKSWGSGAMVAKSTRGVVAGDLNNDGLVDVVTLNERAAATVLQNETKNLNRSITLQLIGTQSNRDAVGAVVTIQQAGKQLVNHVISGHSYQSDSGRQLHFGLSSSLEKVTVLVKWPSGRTESFDSTSFSSTNGFAENLIEGYGRRK